MLSQSTVFNGEHKKTVIEHSDQGYVVKFYIGERIYQKTLVQSIFEAEEMCEQFIHSESNSAKLLNESNKNYTDSIYG